MRQKPRVEPLNPSSPAIELHPMLSRALANLDIQLEDELVRYRRQRTVGRAVPQPGRKFSHPDLIAVSASGAVSAAKPALEERLNGVADPTIAPGTYKPIPAFTANPQPFDAAIALRIPATPTHNVASDKVTLPPEEDALALAQAHTPDLDDYLESSEELLRSLADEQAEVQAERSFMQGLLTPLGLGSMLLLLLSSAMFGYVIMNPSSLGWLMTHRTAPNESPSGRTETTAVAPPQPDLAKRELPELNLNNLGTVNVSPGSSSVATTSPAAIAPSSKPTIAAAKTTTVGQPSSESSSTSTQAPISTQAPMPAVTSGSSKPAPVPAARPFQATVPVRSAPVRAPVVIRRPAPTASVSSAASSGNSSSGSYQYKVGIPFENDQTLENARKVVPDAFVRTLPDGRTIVQRGAYSSETEAKASAQRLQDQGLAAEVYNGKK